MARPLVAGLLALVLVALGLATWGLSELHAGGKSTPRSSGLPPAHHHSSVSPSAGRESAIRALLAKRSRAIVDHDRAAFAATLDPLSSAFRSSQLTMFGNLRQVRFASWSYGLGQGVTGSMTLVQKYDAPVWAPASVELGYRLAGFDSHPAQLRQYPTFVERSGRWYLASLSDFRSRGEVSATDLWDYAPVAVVRTRTSLVMGPMSEQATMTQVSQELRTAIPRVTAVWGRSWARRAVVLVPATEREMGLITQDSGDLDQIAAVTSAEVSNERGRPAPVGGRVTINPQTWPRLGPLGRLVVLTHELTHVATESVTGVQTPRWLQEGFADYVGFTAAGISVDRGAAELAADVREGQVPAHLPADRAFGGANPALAQAYQTSWLACRWIAARYGQPALVRFYREVGTSSSGSSSAVRTALRAVLRLTPTQFTSGWRAYVQSQLAG